MVEPPATIETGTAANAPAISTPPSPSETTDIDETISSLVTAGRVDLTPSGNRVIEGRGVLFDTKPLIVDLPLGTTATWVIPDGAADWLAVLDDGSVQKVTVSGSEAVAEPFPTDVVDPDGAPPLVDADTEPPTITDDAARSFFADPLPDTRVTTDGSRLVALGGPTDRYAHGVLGDELEGSTIEVIESANGARTPVTLDEPDVFEAVSPMLADVDGDGDDDAVLTVSNADSGSRLVAYDLDDGSIVGQSDPIGQGNRWRNLLAVAPIGPNGETEIIDVRTPHIGGTLEFFGLVDGRFETAATAESYSTHRIGSRNLDLGIVTDADGDGQLDVLLATDDMSELAVVTRDARSDDGTREVGRVAFGGDITSNIAARRMGDRVAYAVGSSDGTVILWLP